MYYKAQPNVHKSTSNNLFKVFIITEREFALQLSEYKYTISIKKKQRQHQFYRCIFYKVVWYFMHTCTDA
jgi:hypothetical protein